YAERQHVERHRDEDEGQRRAADGHRAGDGRRGLDLQAHHRGRASMTLIAAGVGTMRATVRPAASTKARYSDPMRSRPPVPPVMLRSVPAIMWSSGDVPGRSGTMPSTMSSREPSRIAFRQLRRMATLFSSSQSWMTLLMM